MAAVAGPSGVRARVAVVVAVTMVAAVLLGAPSAGAIDDTSGPVLTGFSLDPAAVDSATAATPITLTISATDDLSGFEHALVSFRSPSATSIGGSVPASALVSGSLMDGTFEASPVVVPQHAEIGTWVVDEFALVDGAGNERWYQADDLATLGLPATLEVTDASVTVPDAPVIGTAVAGNASASVSWTAPASDGGTPVTGYVVTPYVGAVAQTPVVFDSTATTQTVTGLTNGTSHTFRVAAKNAVGTGPASSASNAVTPATVPGAPTIGTAVAGNARATVSWTSPASNGGSSITGYVVTPYVGVVAQPPVLFSSTATTQTVTGLTNATIYQFRVAARNALGTGAQSAASGAIVVGVVPATPTISGVSAGDGAATVSWEAVYGNGSPVTGYVVTPYLGAVAQPSVEFGSTATSQVLTGLTNGTTYTFRVAATNAVGTGAQSASSAAVTVGVPGTTAIHVIPGDGTAAVSWTAPVSNGSPITGYVVTPYLAGLAQTPVVFSSTARSQVLTGLTNGATYGFRVAATNARGTGPPSPDAVTVTVGAPKQPLIGTAVAGDRAATVSWTAPDTNGSPITGYAITIYTVGYGGFVVVPSGTVTYLSTATTQTVTGLSNGTTYHFRVAAINARGTSVSSAATNSITPLGVPGAPTIGAVSADDGTATVSWSGPGSSGAPVTGYVVTPYLGAVAQTPVVFNSTETSQVLTGLTNGATYTFRVAAINAVGTGAQSASSAAVTVGVPGTTAIHVIPGDGTAAVSWAAPVSNGSPITGYVVTPYLAGLAQTPVVFSSTARSQVLTGLTNGVTYGFRVAATNARGTGPPSPEGVMVTVGAPKQPLIGTAMAGDRSATVSWTAPDTNGSPITGYVITKYRSGYGGIVVIPSGTVTFSSPATTQTVTGLGNGITYHFRVAAINARGTSVNSAATNTVTPAGVPTAPWIGGVSAGDGAATVSWGAGGENGSPITGYVVTPYLGTVAQTPVVFASTATSQVLTGLTNGATYTFKVAATNALGTGPQSASSAAVTVGVPGTTAIHVIPGDGTAAVSWTAPASNGSPITGYVVTPYLGTVAQPPVVFASTATSQVVTGLANGVTYGFRVAATNARGTGPESPDAVTVTVGAPKQPLIGTAVAGDRSATVSWTAPDSNGSAISGYAITIYRSGYGGLVLLASGTVTFSSTATIQTITGLSNGTSYAFRVAAINTRGTSVNSAATNTVTPTL